MPSSDLLKSWHKGLRIKHITHSRAAVRLERQGQILGLSVVILSAIVGTSIFAEAQALGTVWKIVTGLMSAAATVLASVQTFTKYYELAEKHKLSAQKFGNLRREVELFEVSPPQDLAAALKAVQEKWDSLEEESPNVPQDIVDKVMKEREKISSSFSEEK